MTEGAEKGHRGYRFGEYFIDLDRRSLFRCGEEIHLRPRSYQVLCHLAANPGRLVTRDELMRAVWGGTVVTEDALTQCVIDIRRTLGDGDQRMIRTAPRQGYLFDVPVSLAQPEAGPFPEPSAGAAIQAANGRRMRAAVPLLLLLVPIVLILAAVLTWRLVSETPDADVIAEAAHEKSIAVLPFDDMSADADWQYFADGLTEEILNLLARSPELRVIARTSAFSLRGRDDLDAVTIGRLLNVRHLLEGSIRRSGNQIRVTAQLIETGDGTHLWSESFDAVTGNALQVQSRIAQSVAEAMEIALQVRADRPVREPVDPAAYDAYVRARHLHYRRGPGELEQAKALYREATVLDPRFAAPWAGLAGLYSLELSENVASYDIVLEMMGNAARTAMSLDAGLAEAHVRLGSFHGMSGNDDLARSHLERAAELNPNSPLVLGFQAGRAGRDGRYSEAIDLVRQSIALDPLAYVNRLNLVHFLLVGGQYEEAGLELVNARALRSGDAAAAFYQFQIHLLQGRLADAAAMVDELTPGPRQMQARALLQGVGDDEADAESALLALMEDRTPDSAMLVAEVYAFRGDHEEALRWLESGHRRLGPNPTRMMLFDWHTAVRVSPFLQELRDEPAARPYFVDAF